MNTMENLVPGGVEKNEPQESIMSMVEQIRVLDAELGTLKADQEKLREMPDRAEKNTLLGELEEKIRRTIGEIAKLQDKKMEFIKNGDETYMLPVQAENGPTNEDTFESELRRTEDGLNNLRHSVINEKNRQDQKAE